MKYFIDKKKNKEIFYVRSIECEQCINASLLDPLCEGCSFNDAQHRKYSELCSGKIGTAFLEFISIDFEKIMQELLTLYERFKNKNIDEAMLSLDSYLEGQHYFIHLLEVRQNFYNVLSDVYKKVSPLTPEEEIGSSFNDLITIRKIVSAYSEDKYFVEPEILLKAISEYELMFCPSAYVPAREDIYVNIDDDPVKAIKTFAEKCKEMRGNTYELPVFYHMFGIAFDWIVRNNYKISRCENCGKFFVPYGRYDTKYCPYPFRNGKSCRELSFEISIENNAVLKEYRKIYKTKHAWMNRNKATHPTAEKDFAKWHKAAKAMTDKYKLGAVSEMECLKWLEENK